MSILLANWKTTCFGAALVVLSIGFVLGRISGADFLAATGVLAAGGLLAAGDAKH